MKSVLQALAWLFFVFGGLSFWVGGRAISEFAKIDRILAEILGLGLAGLCFALGMVLKNAGEIDEVGEDQNSTSGDSSLPK